MFIVDPGCGWMLVMQPMLPALGTPGVPAVHGGSDL
jgi:hypothetical protein